jgi:hypothetical protein
MDRRRQSKQIHRSYPRRRPAHASGGMKEGVNGAEGNNRLDICCGEPSVTTTQSCPPPLSTLPQRIPVSDWRNRVQVGVAGFGELEG